MGIVDSLSDQIHLLETTRKTENDHPNKESAPISKSELEKILDLEDEEDRDSSVEYLGRGPSAPIAGRPNQKRLKTNEFETGLSKLSGSVTMLQREMIAKLRSKYHEQKQEIMTSKRPE